MNGMPLESTVCLSEGWTQLSGLAPWSPWTLGDPSHISHTDTELGGFPQGPLPFPSLPVSHPLCAGEVQAFYEDLSGRQYVNEIFNFSVDKLYDLLFTDSPFQRDFMEQRRFSGLLFPRLAPPTLLPSLPKHSPFPGHPMAQGTLSLALLGARAPSELCELLLPPVP